LFFHTLEGGNYVPIVFLSKHLFIHFASLSIQGELSAVADHLTVLTQSLDVMVFYTPENKVSMNVFACELRWRLD
jgi:hypothetical protein